MTSNFKEFMADYETTLHKIDNRSFLYMQYSIPLHYWLKTLCNDPKATQDAYTGINNLTNLMRRVVRVVHNEKDRADKAEWKPIVEALHEKVMRFGKEHGLDTYSRHALEEEEQTR